MAHVTNQTDVLTASLGRPIALAYGKHLVGGNMILLDESDPEVSVAMIALGEGEWDGIEQLIVNGLSLDLPLAGAEFHFHKGLTGQLSTPGGLEPEGIGSPYPFDTDGDQKADGFTPPMVQGLTFSKTAYVALRIPFDANAPFPDLQVLGIYRTRKVRIFDAGGVLLSTAYSENPAWQIVDLLTKIRGLNDSRIHFASFKASADYCDALITPLPGGDQVKRFVSNTAFTEEIDFDQALAAILITCRGFVYEEEGLIKLRIDQTRASVFDFQDQDTSGGVANIVDSSFAAWREETRKKANRLELLFRDTANNFQVMTKNWNHEPQQTAVGRKPTSRVQLGNMEHQQAERIGNYLLTRDIDNNLFCRFQGTPATLAVMPGDRVRVKHDAAPWGQGLSGAALYHDFEVLDVTEHPDDTREFLCREYNANTYPDTAGPAPNLVGTVLRGRPLGPGLPPPQPQVWSLTANLDGELRLSFSIPLLADYRTGILALWADEEKTERVTTNVPTAPAFDATSITVDNSVGFKVGDHVSFDTEVVKIVGPGPEREQPTSNTWEIARLQLLSSQNPAYVADATVLNGAAIHRLIYRQVDFALEAGWSLAHPTIDLANGEYFVVKFRPGRLRIAYASLILYDRFGQATLPLARGFLVYGAGEPFVPGTLPGRRTSDGGYLLFEINGPLVAGDNGLEPITVQGSHSNGIMYAAVLGAPTTDMTFKVLLDGVPYQPNNNNPLGLDTWTIPAGMFGTGVFLSGSVLGNIGGKKIAVSVIAPGGATDFKLFATV